VVTKSSFYTRLFRFIPMIKARGVVAGYGEDLMPWVSPVDIATAAADELELLVTTGAQAASGRCATLPATR